MARRLETLFERYRRRGDASALGRVFDRTAPEILRVAMHLAHHPAEAEDLLQETFLTAIAKAERYDAARPLVPWLLGILKNHARAARRRRVLVDGSVDERASEHESCSDVGWTDDIAARVEALPDPYREVLVLLLRHEKTPAEIAVLLDRPPATVRSQIHRGLDRLRRSLPPDLRSAGLAALPIGDGLVAIRARVVTDATAGAVATGTTVGTGTLLLAGGLAMSKKSVLTILVVVGCAALGTAAWQGGFLALRDPEQGATERPEVVRSSAENAHVTPSPPSLAGSPTAVPAAEPPSRPPEPAETVPAVWPPALPIPADKGSVAGHIRFKDGKPLVGARVGLWGGPTVTAVTDERGRFHLHGERVHDGAVFLVLGGDEKPGRNSLILAGDVAMKAGEMVIQDITIERGVVIEAAVIDVGTNEPLVDAKVTIRRVARDRAQARAGFARTDSRGRFRFPYVPADAYTLELNKVGYRPIEREFDLRDGEFPARWGMNVARQLTLRFDDLPEGALGTTVVVYLQRRGGSSLSVSSSHTIGPDGSVSIDAPEPGLYMLVVFKTEHIPRLEHRLEITEEPLELILLTVPQGARVVGVIRDADGEPIAGVPVRIDEASSQSQTNARGAFLVTRVPAGRRRVLVQLEEAWVSFAEVEVPESGMARVVLSAPGTARIEGRFLVAGRPVGLYDGEVTVRHVESEVPVASVGVGAPGHFTIPMLASGRYVVVAWGKGGIPEHREVTLDRGQALDLGDIDLQPYLRVPVELVLPPGVKVGRDVVVVVRDPEAPASVFSRAAIEVGGRRFTIAPELQTDGDGRTWVEGLHPGRAQLMFWCDGCEPTLVEVDVVPNMVRPVRVEVRAN